MGREIRRVPPNWEHPQKQRFDPFRRTTEMAYQPLYDQSAESAWNEWNNAFREWLDGGFRQTIVEHPDLDYSADAPYRSFCDWHGQPPDPTYYRPDWPDDEATWWQVYETVSEGTPVTPPFETREELVEYLMQNGDFWDQKRREEGRSTMNCQPWSRKQAETFVFGSGWSPSLVADSKGIRSGVEALPDLERRNQDT